MCGTCCFDSVSRRAITLRIFDSFTASCGISPGTAGAGAATGVGAAVGADAGAEAGAGARAVPAGTASRSALTIRPWGPDPLTAPRSIPCACASRRARGLAFTRSPSGETGAGGGAAAGASALATGSARGALSAGFAAGAGAAFAGAGAEVASSSSPVISAITVPTFTASDPSGITIFETVPSSTASNSIVALSVSISARRSPERT